MKEDEIKKEEARKKFILDMNKVMRGGTDVKTVANMVKDFELEMIIIRIHEVTVVVNNEKVVSDVLVNGKPVKCYCVVPKDQLQTYLKGRHWND